MPQAERMKATLARKAITKQRMQEILNRCPDDVVFVVPSSDHSYRTVRPQAGYAWLEPSGGLSEFWDDGSIFEGCVKIPVVILD